MIYKIDGTALNTVYNVDGQSLSQAYDVDGNPLLSDSPITLKVMTYNTQWLTGLNANDTMQEEIFETYDADIIGFQEFAKASASTIPSKYYTLLPSYPYILMGNYGNKNAIASKYAMSGFSTTPFTVQTMDGQSWSKATITVRGVTLTLIVAHTTYGRTGTAYQQKVDQITELFNEMQNYDNVIVMADINTWCSSVNDQEYTDIMSMFVNAGYHCANCTAEFGFIDTWTDGYTAEGTWQQADHIFTSSNIVINSVIRDTTKFPYAEASQLAIDHVPLIANLTVSNGEESE